MNGCIRGFSIAAALGHKRAHKCLGIVLDLLRHGRVGLPADDDSADRCFVVHTTPNASGDAGPVIRDIWLLRLRALLARADGDDTAYRDYRDRHRDMARTLGFEGHIDWAEAMP